MAKKKKQDREYTDLEKLTRNETRNLDQLPEWKQREIRRMRANEARIAEEQDAKDRRRGRGAYHPDVLAAQAQANAQKQATDQYMSSVAGSMIDSIESSSNPQNFFQPPAIIPGNRGAEYKPIPEQYASNFWEDETFPTVVKAIQTKGAKKASTYVPSQIDPATLKTPGHPSQVPVVLSPFAGSNLGAGAGVGGRNFNNYESMMAARTASAKSGIKSAVQGLLGSTGPKTSIKPPAYLMTLYGPEGSGSDPMPFFEGEMSTYESIKETTKDSPNWLVREGLPMLFAGFKVGEHEIGLGGLIDMMYQGADVEINGRVIKGLTLGGMSEEEWVYQENPNGPQAAIQAAFNLGIWGFEAIRYALAGGSALSPENIQDPSGMEQAKREQAEKMGEAWSAFERSWESGIDAWADAEIIPSNNPYLTPDERTQTRMDEKLKVSIEREAAQIRSEEFSAAATETWQRATDNFTPGPEQATEYRKAIDFQIQSIEERRKTDPMDAWGAATWQRQPEKYQYFLENAATLELQLGRPLTHVEIRRLKDMYTNVNTELAFQLVFDVTNIIPAISQVTQVSSAFPIIGKMKASVAKGIGKVTDYIPVVRWLKAPAVNTVATQIANNTDNLARKMINAYRMTPELIRAFKTMEPLIADFKLAKTLDAQAVVFEKARKLIPGTAEWDIADFKRFTDSVPEGVELSAEFSTAQKMVQQAVFDTAKKNNPTWNQARLERYATKMAQSPTTVELTTRMFGNRMAEAFKASHRIFENSSLYDDTLIGQIVKKFALLTANVPSAVRKQVNPKTIYRSVDAVEGSTLRSLIVKAIEHPKNPLKGRGAEKLGKFFRDIRTFDDWMVEMGVGLTGDGADWLRLGVVDGLEHAVRMGNIMRQAWMGLVLTTPRWLVTNLIDSMGRGFIYGESIYDDLSTLIFSTQRHFGDNSPIQIPREMSTSLARTEVDMLDEVSIRLMYEHPDELPGMNPFSFIAREHSRRYAAARTDRVNPSLVGLTDEMKNKYITRLGKNAASPVNKVWDWIKVIPGSFQGAAADFNTSIEFTLRSRMFYRSYMRNFKDLEARAITALIDQTEDYSPFMKEMMTRIYQEAEGSPSKMKGLVESLLRVSNKDTKDLNQMYTWLLPSDWLKASEMEPERMQLFTHTVRENVEQFIDTTFKKTGDIPTSQEWDRFIDNFQKNMENSYQEVMSIRGKEFKNSGMDDTIDPMKRVQKSPNHKDLKGPNPQNMEAQKLAALDIIKRKGGRGKFNPEVIKNSYKTVMTDVADIVESAGNKATVTISNGKPKITIGDEFWDQPREQLYSALRDATVDVIAIRNAEYLDLISMSKNQFRAVANEFMEDASAVLARDEKSFVLMMDEMDNNPILRDLLAATNKAGMDRYEGAKSLYAQTLNSRFSFELNGVDAKDIRAILRKKADDVMAPMVERRRAAIEEGAAAVRIVQLSEISSDSSFRDTVHLFMNQRERTRRELAEFGRLVWPGPGTTKSGELRSNGWDVLELLQAKGFEVETSFFKELEDTTQKLGYEAGRKYMDDMMENFNEEYLRRVGLDVIWKDESKTEIFQIKNRFGGSFVTWSDGSPEFDYIKQRFFGEKTGLTNVLDMVVPGSDTPLRHSIISKVRVSTGITYDQATAWTRMMETHAKRWMDITGGTMEEYFSRFSVQAGAEVPYLTRTADGGYRFISDTSGDLPTFLKQTSEILFNDMQELAKYDEALAEELRVIARTIEDSTLRKSVLLKYIDLDETQRINMREFMLGKLGEPKFNEAWNGISKILEGQKMGPELMDKLGKFQTKYGLDEEDMLRLLNSSYPTIKKADVKRYVEALNINRTMDAAEYNAVFSELFMEYLQTGWAPPGMPKAFNRFKEWLATDFEVLNRMQFDMTDEVDRALTSIFIEQVTAPTNTDEMTETLRDLAKKLGLDPDAIIAEARAARKAARMSKTDAVKETVEAVAPELPKFPDNFADFTTDDLERMAARTVGEKRTTPLPAESLSMEIDEVWKLYLKNRQSLRQYPAEALTSPWAFRKYAKNMADSLPPAAAEPYLRNIADIDDVIRKVAQAPSEFPKVADFQLNNGVRTFLRASEQINGDFEEMKRALQSLRSHLTSGKVQVPVLDDFSKKQLLEWLPDAMDAKAKTVSVATYGGEFEGRGYNGAIKRVNDIMLDYTDQSRFDTLMKGLFPFWMFPSRSIPFWMKTAATHPELIAFYNKMKRYSEANRMQAGAVTSDGRPIDTLDGYMPIPGTDIWINPLAPLSFRYVLAIPEMIEELTRSAGYNTSKDEEVDPMTWSVRKVMEIGPMVGFNMAPWTAGALKYTMGLPDSVMPKFPAAPFISLIPRWFVYDMIQKADKIAFGDFKLGQFLYPEADFNEANTERRIYQNALEQMREPGANKALIVENVKKAVMERQGNALWDETYKELTNQQAMQSIGSYFTGFYAKPFSDSQAELYALRNELNILKSSMNNEFQASIFKLDGDAQARWTRYLETQDLDETQLYRLYVQSGWVRDEAGNLVSDPQKRAVYLKEAILAEQKQQAKYNGMEVARNQLDTALRNLPIGSSYEVISKVYQRYYDTINKLYDSNETAYDRSFGTWKPVELIQGEIRDEFYYILLSTRPRFDENMSHDEYQRRMAAWEQTLPMLAPDVMRSFVQRSDIAALLGSLKEDQKFDTSFWTALNKESQTAEGIHAWQLEKDDMFDALNNAWSELYWHPYWENSQGLSSMERELYDEDFATNNPPPTAEQLYSWIRETYGTKFSLDDVRKWVNGTEVLDIEKRLVQQRTQEQTLRSQIWDYMAWLGPSKDQEMIQYLEKAILDAVGEDPTIKGDILSDMMERNNNLFRGDPQTLQKLVNIIEQVYKDKRVQEPTREQWVQYVKAQDSNEQFKKLINQEFVDLSPDYAKTGVTPYDVIQDFQSEYFAVENSKSYSYKYKKTNPEEYAILQEYWTRKRQYGRTDKVWNMYYNMSEDKQNIPTQFTGIFGLDEAAGVDFMYQGGLPNTSGSLYGQPQQRGVPSYSPTRQQNSVPEVSLPNAGGVPTQVPVSIGLKRAMGNLLAWEVNSLMSIGRPLTQAAVDFFIRLQERHPEWKAEIDEILKLSGSNKKPLISRNKSNTILR